MAKRFEKVLSEGFSSGMELWVDTETGVQYLYHYAGYGGGFTVLVGPDGKPLLYRPKDPAEA